MQKKISISIFFKTLVFFFLFIAMSYAQYPVAVEQNLKKAGNNRAELEKAIAHCKKSNDPQKLKAIYFLISNMDIHETEDYYWETTDGKKIAFNELDYPDFDQAAKAFESIKMQNPGLQPKAFTSKDLETIKGDFLIKNLEQAFTAWKNSPIKTTSFDAFCEYILPYRISVEPLQEWRTTYREKFAWAIPKIDSLGLFTTLGYIRDDAKNWFSSTWRTQSRKEPLPRLGSLQLLMRKQGHCDDLAGMGVFTLRSLGVPATAVAIPYWATSTSGHQANTFWDKDQKAIYFDYAIEEIGGKLKREPAKVFQITYSKQPQSLGAIEDPKNIPSGFLRLKNYIDKTKDYWETATVKTSLFPNPNKPKTAYIATLNGLTWKTFWWGKIENNQTQFDQICKGTVILPQYYYNEKMVPAANPILVGAKENRVLTPDFAHLQDVTIGSMAGYLLLKPTVTYKLYYWSMGWKLVDAKTADLDTQSFVYQKVPKNALLLLVSSDSKGYERPFVIDENGERAYY